MMLSEIRRSIDARGSLTDEGKQILLIQSTGTVDKSKPISYIEINSINHFSHNARSIRNLCSHETDEDRCTDLGQNLHPMHNHSSRQFEHLGVFCLRTVQSSSDEESDWQRTRPVPREIRRINVLDYPSNSTYSVRK